MGPLEDGAIGNYWTTVEDFPEYSLTSYYLQSTGKLSLNLPIDTSQKEMSTSYTYDPLNPTPTIGGNNLFYQCGPIDQTILETRDDILIFQTDVFDETIAITGPLTAVLYVQSDAIDTDFMVKLIDVYPDGSNINIQDSAIRMRWRDATPYPTYMESNSVYKVEISLWNTSRIINSGHSIKIHISSSNYPRFSVNPNNGILLVDTPEDSKVAKNTIYHSTQYPSHILLPIVSLDQLPPTDNVRLLIEDGILLFTEMGILNENDENPGLTLDNLIHKKVMQK